MTDSITQQSDAGRFNGVLVLDKPAGITSARAVGAVKRLLPRGTKVGHAGTLDRFATGVLLILIGKATKSCEMLMDQPKAYEATIKLGATTESLDPDTPERENQCGSSAAPVLVENLTSALQTFVGTIEQRPPTYSAVKVKGRRASDRIRDGEAIVLSPRPIVIYSIDLVRFDWPLVQLRIACGRGTYVRSIARDLGEKLSVGGYLVALRRTQVGRFSVDRAARPDELTTADILSRLLPASLAV